MMILHVCIYDPWVCMWLSVRGHCTGIGKKLQGINRSSASQQPHPQPCQSTSLGLTAFFPLVSQYSVFTPVSQSHWFQRYSFNAYSSLFSINVMVLNSPLLLSANLIDTLDSVTFKAQF